MTKVARTIADLDETEAIQYRSLDRAGWLG